MTKTSAVEFPEKLSADGVIDIQERLGNGHKRLSVDEADGEACIVCRFGKIILVLILVFFISRLSSPVYQVHAGCERTGHLQPVPDVPLGLGGGKQPGHHLMHARQ